MTFDNERKQKYLDQLQELCKQFPGSITVEVAAAWQLLACNDQVNEEIIYTLLNLLCRQSGYIHGLNEILNKNKLLDVESQKKCSAILEDVVGTLREMKVLPEMADEIEKLTPKIRIYG